MRSHAYRILWKAWQRCKNNGGRFALVDYEMIRKSILNCAWVVLFLLPALLLQAQKTNPQKPVAKPVAKPAVPVVLPDTVKVPKFTVRFGPYNGATPAPVEDMKKVLGTGITVTDQQGQKWTPLTWMFVWNKQEQSNDIKTGRTKNILTYNAVQVDSTGVLPATWQNEIRDYLKSGEEFVLERIIIEHPGSKRKMMAPDLRIKVL